MATSLSQFWILVVSVYTHAVQAAEGANTNGPLNLTFVLITSYGRYGFNSSGTLPAADIALERINNRPDLLPGYNLVYDTVRNSEVCYWILKDPAKSSLRLRIASVSSGYKIF